MEYEHIVVFGTDIKIMLYFARVHVVAVCGRIMHRTDIKIMLYFAQVHVVAVYGRIMHSHTSY